uniref:Retrovirus-related Pol polyprotein from transposon TNT 1-94-like beta-barrel domain-containing protein n=1 Tax=Timema cristinae TaxID=61476 RepID=A0A7R9CC00_TIMCR|nr:unnamed protein product [Timema cristinae]
MHEGKNMADNLINFLNKVDKLNEMDIRISEELLSMMCQISMSTLHTQPTRSNDVWCVDNGATTHICRDKSRFLELTPTVNQKVWLADDNTTEIVNVLNVKRQRVKVRLTPAYAAMILLQVGVLPRLGSGPMFGQMYNKTINACDQYWWAALLYFQNFLKPRNMPVVIVGWVGNILIMLAAQYLIYPIQQPDYVYDRLACSFYFALFRTCWALGVAWIVFSCVAGYGGPVNKLLSWKGWIPLSRLTYCIYLVHLPLIRFQAYSMKVEMYMDIPQQEAAITSLPNGSNEKYQLCSSHLEKSYLARTGADLEQIWHS